MDTIVIQWYVNKWPGILGPVARSMVSANNWLNGIKINGWSWYLTLVSANQASSNPALKFSQLNEWCSQSS